MGSVRGRFPDTSYSPSIRKPLPTPSTDGPQELKERPWIPLSNTEEANKEGYFVGPTVFSEVKRGMQIYVPSSKRDDLGTCFLGLALIGR